MRPASIRAGVAAIAMVAAALAGPALAAEAGGKIPRLASGKPDFSGIWQTLSEANYDLEPHAGRVDAPPSPGVVEGGKLPYRPEALEQKQKNYAARDSADPSLKCWSLGVPRSVYYPAPFQIFEREHDLTLVHQLGHQVRTINTNGSLHPEDEGLRYFNGDSRAHWEGDTLVVDVKNFNDKTWFDRVGNYHSNELHVVERWSFLDPNTISYSATVEDPKVFTKPFTLNIVLNRRREKNFQLIEDYCFTLPSEQFYPHKDGQ